MRPRHANERAAERRPGCDLQLDRLLDRDNGSVTLHTLHRAAAILGKRLRVDLVY